MKCQLAQTLYDEKCKITQNNEDCRSYMRVDQIQSTENGELTQNCLFFIRRSSNVWKERTSKYQHFRDRCRTGRREDSKRHNYDGFVYGLCRHGINQLQPPIVKKTQRYTKTCRTCANYPSIGTPYWALRRL